jgi:ubiquinone/menaquinone biosynthesis C-methylase UbiE
MSAAAMSPSNDAQIADWNGLLGQRWVEFQPQLDRMIEAFGAAALQCAAPRAGERVLDIGCGCGSSSLALAQAVGPQGGVLGVDISRPMLAVARRRGAAAGAAALSFVEADASHSLLPAGHDLLFSRFGLMFFAQPAPALRHLRGALRAGGRCVFVCWRAPRDNPWAMAPLVAARQALGIKPAPADPLAPGPFAFADEQRLRGLLAEAGFEGIEVQRLDAPIRLGDSAREAAAHSLQIGPASMLAAEAGPAQEPALVAAIASALAPHADADGSVSLAGSTWLVRAVNPA